MQLRSYFIPLFCTLTFLLALHFSFQGQIAVSWFKADMHTWYHHNLRLFNHQRYLSNAASALNP